MAENLKETLATLVADRVHASEDADYFREPLVGFASADDPLFAQLPEVVGPHHMLPCDLLPSAKTVMAFFVPFTKPIVDANRRTGECAPEWQSAYLRTNRFLNAMSEELVRVLAEKGIEAEMVRATHTYDPQLLKAPWSHRSAAFVAGLGRFGMNRMLITKKGCGGRYGSIVFAEAVPYDARSEEEYCLAKKGGGCTYCVDRCPVGALKPDAFDRHACNDQLLRNGEKFSETGADCCGLCVVGPCAYIE
ncbi:hypothetical protein LJC31_06265 [Synergistaceae bacterium OttesenSCG-928-I11]|nr:hypothetical protein [Synergistaceae bacterium OttesenSCG-928-I11]